MAESHPALPKSTFLCRRAVGSTLVARTEGARIVTLNVILDHEPGGVGQVHVGRVVRLVPSLDAAFVDIGQARPAFLTLDDVASSPTDAASAKKPGIRGALREGQHVLVQIRRAAHDEKGARVTTRISLPGRYVVATEGERGVSTSQRLEGNAQVEEAFKALQPIAEAYNLQLLLRTNAQTVSSEAIVKEARRLAEQIAMFRASAKPARKARLLGEEQPTVVSMLLEAGVGPHTTFFVDDSSLRQILTTHLSDEDASLDMRPFSQWRGADSAFAFEQALSKALATRVYLPSGGTLVIERTEAMWTIDVNSGQAISHANKPKQRTSRKDAMHALNVEAARVAGEQIVLRNLGGLIVLDCIEGAPRDAPAVAQALKDALATERQRYFVSAKQDLGLVAMTRTQRRSPLIDSVGASCDSCQAPHRLLAPWYVATRALWAVDTWLSQRESPMVLIQCATPVATSLWDEGHALVAALGEKHRTSIVPIARSEWPRAHFELVDTGMPGDTLFETLALF